MKKSPPFSLPKKRSRVAEQPLPTETVTKRSRRRLILPSVVGVAALSLGAMIGGSGSAAQISTLKTEQQTLTSAVASAEKQSEFDRDARTAATQKADERAAELEAEIEALRGELSAQSEARAASDEAVQSKDEEIARLTADVAAARAAAPAPSGSSTQPRSFVAPRSAAPAPAQAPAPRHFNNCSEARAAGAAPVRAGQPGYGRHLDRDGDGVGCE